VWLCRPIKRRELSGDLSSGNACYVERVNLIYDGYRHGKAQAMPRASVFKK